LNGAEKSRLAFERNLIIILEELRKQNPTATIYLFGLYNPFGDLPEGPEAARLIGEWNATMTDVAARFNKVVVVPTSDLFQLNPRAYLYSDHFHPNARGYALMAERLMQLMPELQGGEK
jgi:lysophospholipase L1-like esterase